MSKKEDFVLELHTAFFEARNALTRFEHVEKPSDKAKSALKDLTDEMKAVTKQLADKREALLKEIK